MSARSIQAEPPSAHGPVRDLVAQLERAADEAALRLTRARDPSLKRTSQTLAMRAEGLLLAHVLGRPRPELEADARQLLRALVQLEFSTTRSRLPIADRAAVTMARALASQVLSAFAG